MFALGSYAPPHPRLLALTWGAEDLAAALGATDNKEPDGSWTFPYELARAQCLFAAAAAEVAGLDTVFTNFRDREGSNGIAGARGATVLLAASPFTLIRSQSSTAPMRRPKPRSRTRGRSSPRSRPIPAQARSASMARWSTFRI